MQASGSLEGKSVCLRALLSAWRAGQRQIKVKLMQEKRNKQRIIFFILNIKIGSPWYCLGENRLRPFLFYYTILQEFTKQFIHQNGNVFRFASEELT